mmetsp:Transcript_30454/g.86088  ORF Transcript_30454/g.86088 Transcript_30454/m.86088 type:complete len:207 (+) Transcript_30454:486-1106(+)
MRDAPGIVGAHRRKEGEPDVRNQAHLCRTMESGLWSLYKASIRLRYWHLQKFTWCMGKKPLSTSKASVHPRVANYFPCRVSDQRSTACTREGAGASLACASLASMACMSSACIMTARPPALEPARTMASAPAMPWLRRRSYSNACDIERQMFDLKATMAICINATFACSAQQAKAPIVAAGSVPCAVCVLLKEGGRRGRRAVAMIS